MSSSIQNYTFLNDSFSQNVSISLVNHTAAGIRKIDNIVQKQFCLMGLNGSFCEEFPISSQKSEVIMPSFVTKTSQINAYIDAIEKYPRFRYRTNSTYFPVSYYRYVNPGFVRLGRDGQLDVPLSLNLNELKESLIAADESTITMANRDFRERRVKLQNQFLITNRFESAILQNPYFFDFKEESIIKFLKKMSYILVKNDSFNKHPEEFRYEYCENEYYYKRRQQLPKPASTKNIEQQMISFIKNMKVFSKQNIPPLALGSWAHSEIIRIFPFCGTNGKIARMLMNTIFVRFGQPPLIIPDQEDYYNAVVKNLEKPGSFTRYLTKVVIPWNRGKEKFYLTELEPGGMQKQ